jgi:hypothetical protein
VTSLGARVAAAFAVFAVLVAWTVPANAETTAASAGPVLVLVSQDAWVKPGGVFTMHLRANAGSSPGSEAAAAPTTAALNLVLILHERVTTRSAFDATATEPTQAQPNPALPTPLGTRISAPFDSLAVDEAGNRVFTVPLQGPNDPQSLDHLAANRAGTNVYPLEVQLRDGDDQRVSGFVTYVVVTSVAPGTGDGTTAPVWSDGRAMDVTWVWPLVAPPAYLPDGSPDPKVVGEFVPEGRLGRQAAAIDQMKDIPLTLVPSPETVDAWQAITRQRVDVSPGIAALQRAATHDEILAGPFVNLDLPALTSAGLESALDGEFTRGSAALDRVFGLRLDPCTALPGPLDQHALQLLRQRCVDRVVLADPSTLVAVNEPLTPSHPSIVQSTPGDDSTAVTAVVGDAGFERFLTGDQPPALRAARLLAGLTIVARDQPFQRRGIALVNPTDWDPDDAFVAAVAAGLRGNPVLSPVTVTTFLSDVPTADGPPRAMASRGSPASPPVTAKQFAAGTANLGAVNDLLGPTNPIVARGDRGLYTSLYSGWQANADSRAHARAQLDGIGHSVQGFLSGIGMPLNTTVTVTSSQAEIPITFRNDTGQVVRVHVRFESDKLLFPGGAERDIELPPRNTTVRFSIETRSSGTFPVAVTLTTAGATPLPIQSAQLRVRSTFVSGVGIFLTVAAGVFLALWWGWDIRRRRRAKRAGGPRPTVAPASA